ncbi:MAG: hypothetical protein AB1626_04970 [Candidatus Micrarchaeota archaeon]
MKQTNLYEIRERALKSSRAVYSAQQLANLVGKPKSVAKVYLSRLANKGLATKILRGRIAFTDDDFVIASQLLEPAYVSLHSALLFHGLVQQVPKNVECATPRKSRTYASLGLTYHKIPSSLFYGYEKHRRGQSYVFMASLEKALVDGVYLNAFPKKLVSELMEKVDSEKLESYVKRFKGTGRKKLEKWLL